MKRITFVSNKIRLSTAAKAGFTLVEVVVTTAIVSIILIVIGAFFRDIFFLGSITGTSIETQHSMRQVLRQFAKETRTASVSVNGAYPIAEATESQVTLYADVTGDGVPEKITYVHDGTLVYRYVYEASGAPLTYPDDPTSSTVIADEVVNTSDEPVFIYYASGDVANSSPLEDPVLISSVRYIVMSLVLDANPSRPPAAITVTTGASIRNLKDNL